MKVFTIDKENNITVYSSRQLPAHSGDPVFATPAELTMLSESWPAARLVEIWNSLTGVVPVKRFTDRKTAVTRIWKAIQSLEPAERVRNVESQRRNQQEGPSIGPAQDGPGSDARGRRVVIRA